jgi:hypothetical protein
MSSGHSLIWSQVHRHNLIFATYCMPWHLTDRHVSFRHHAYIQISVPHCLSWSCHKLLWQRSCQNVCNSVHKIYLPYFAHFDATDNTHLSTHAYCTAFWLSVQTGKAHVSFHPSLVPLEQYVVCFRTLHNTDLFGVRGVIYTWSHRGVILLCAWRLIITPLKNRQYDIIDYRVRGNKLQYPIPMYNTHFTCQQWLTPTNTSQLY